MVTAQRKGSQMADAGDMPRYGQVVGAPRLTKERQMQLGAESQRGRWAEQAKKGMVEGPAGSANMEELDMLIKRGDDARNELVAGMSKIAFWFANKPEIQRMARIAGCEFMDVVQEANLGLIAAARSYDPAWDTGFGAYAYGAMRNRAFALFARNDEIRIPAWVPVWLSAYQDAVAFLQKNRNPDEAQLAELLRESNEAHKLVRAMLSNPDSADALRRKRDSILENLANTRNCISLETPVGEDGDTKLGDLLGFDPTETTLRGVEWANVRRAVMKVLGETKPRDARMFLTYFSVDGATHQNIADSVASNRKGREKMTRERVRQIMDAIIERIRAELGVENTDGKNRSGHIRANLTVFEKGKILRKMGVPEEIYNRWPLGLISGPVLAELVTEARRNDVIGYIGFHGHGSVRKKNIPGIIEAALRERKLEEGS